MADGGEKQDRRVEALKLGDPCPTPGCSAQIVSASRVAPEEYETGKYPSVVSDNGWLYTCSEGHAHG